MEYRSANPFVGKFVKTLIIIGIVISVVQVLGMLMQIN